jgi:hypothetical protein
LDVSGYNSILLDITISGSATANFKVRNSYTETWRDLGCVKTDDTNPAERFTIGLRAISFSTGIRVAQQLGLPLLFSLSENLAHFGHCGTVMGTPARAENSSNSQGR